MTNKKTVKNTKVQDKGNKKEKKKAFSLIELSVVMILIGLLAVGVIGGQALIQQAQVAKARSLTSSSPVMIVEDLSLWLETTLDQNDVF
jgi:prepilin-type N-terminal cleavage/methylation domain-containing protein